MSSQNGASIIQEPPQRDGGRRQAGIRAPIVGAVLAVAVQVVAGLFTATPVQASDTADATAGLAKSAICASCHGPLGLSPVPTYPNLAGQNRLYLDYALRLYRSGERRGDQAGMMYTVAQALSDTDIGDLAAYYASLPRPD